MPVTFESASITNRDATIFRGISDRSEASTPHLCLEQGASPRVGATCPNYQHPEEESVYVSI